MSIHLNIQAEIIDISSDTPSQDDIFLVDTNVWIWQTYTNANASSHYAINKIKAYTPYLTHARRNGSTLAYSSLILAELAHVIEKTERQIYNQRTGNSLSAKEYRHNCPEEREHVVEEVKSAWRTIENLAIPINLKMDDSTPKAILERFQTQALDGYDLLMLEAISQEEVGTIKMITDDMDYAVVPGIQVFTNNGAVIRQAKEQDTLLVRSAG